MRTSPLSLLLVALPLMAQEPSVLGEGGRRLDSLMGKARDEGFHGSVLVARRGQPVLLAGYGQARHRPDAPFTPATLVQIGSNVKDFTATAVYQLVEGGRLRLDDSLSRFFPDLPADKRSITVRQLLTHRAGLPLGVALDQEPLSRDEMLRRFRALELEFPPGEREQYSNLGYSLLAAIVEQVSGRPYEAYLAARVFAPAGMTQTGLTLPRFDTTRVAHGYARGRERGTVLDLPRDEDGHLWSLRGNGGMLSTLADMHRFYRALRDTVLLRSGEHRRAVVPLDEPGVWAGSDRVSFFAYASEPRDQVEIVLASNHQEFSGQRILRSLQEVLGFPVPEAAGVATVGPALDRIPEEGIGRTVAAFVAAYNSGDTAVMRRSTTSRWPPRPAHRRWRRSSSATRTCSPISGGSACAGRGWCRAATRWWWRPRASPASRSRSPCRSSRPRPIACAAFGSRWAPRWTAAPGRRDGLTFGISSGSVAGSPAGVAPE